jgi:hypothetical protein
MVLGMPHHRGQHERVMPGVSVLEKKLAGMG